VQRAPGIPCALLFLGRNDLQNPGETRRGIEKLRFAPSLRAKRSNPSHGGKKNGLLRRFAPRNDDPGCWKIESVTTIPTPSFRGARSASPESILAIVVMDSGLSPAGLPRNDER
jgi:hypothetical protein